MSAVFWFLFVVAIGAFLIAIKKPVLFHRKNFKPTQKQIFSGAGATALVAIVGLAFSMPSATLTAASTQISPVTQSTRASTQPKTAKVTKQEVTTTPIDFSVKTVDDSTLPVGKSVQKQVGVMGERTTIFNVTYVDGQETSRKQVSDSVTTPAIDQVVAHGTYAPAQAAADNDSTDSNDVPAPCDASSNQTCNPSANTQ